VNVSATGAELPYRYSISSELIISTPLLKMVNAGFAKPADPNCGLLIDAIVASFSSRLNSSKLSKYQSLIL
jgi:hypothetical protein